MGIVSRFMAWLGCRPLPTAAVPAGAPPARLSWARALEAALPFLAADKRRLSQQTGERVRSLKLPKPWPGVLPENTAPIMAQDSQIGAVLQFGAGLEWDGYGFMGFALLAELSQIPEFRRPSEILANEMTRKWIKLVSTGDDDKSEKIKVLEDDMERFGVHELFRRAFECDNFFGRGQIFVDLGTIGDELKTPLLLKTKIKKGGLKALTLVEPMWTYPNQYNSTNPLAPNFYQPQTWYVMGTEVHTSRLLTFNSRPVPDMLKPSYMFGGLSLTQMMKPYVENWLRTRQSVSDITHNFSTPVLGVDMDQMTTAGGAQSLALRAQIYNTMRDNQGLLVMSKEKESFEIVAAPLGSLDKLQAQAQEQMAAICGIPLVKLFGITPSGLNASSDGEVRVFYDTIESVQERIGTPQLKIALDVLQMNAFGEIDPGIGFVWEPLWALDEKERAEVDKIEAETAQIDIDTGAIAPAERRKVIADRPESPYHGLDPDDAPDLRAEEEQGLEPAGGRPDPLAERSPESDDREMDGNRKAA